MFCIKCGQELPEGAAFCLSCGARLSIGQKEEKVKACLDEAEEAGQPVETMPLSAGAQGMPVMAPAAELYNSEQEYAGIVQLGIVLREAVKDKTGQQKEMPYARIRISKKQRSKMNLPIFLLSVYFICLGILGCLFLDEISSITLILVVISISFSILFFVAGWTNNAMIKNSDLFVSNLRCYGTDVHKHKVSFCLEDIVSVEPKNKTLIFTITTNQQTYIFTSTDVGTVCELFRTYLSNR